MWKRYKRNRAALLGLGLLVVVLLMAATAGLVEPIDPLRRAGAHLLFALGGAAAAIAAMAIVPPRGTSAVNPPEVCTWKHRDLAPPRDARTMTLSCVVCHLERDR